MEKVYDHLSVEDRLYNEWESKGYFKTEIDESKKPFTVMMPPPNVTSQLHMGHALDCTLQDIMVRYRRMQGYAALWVPGTDHASIATEHKLVEALTAEGLTKKDIGREKFLDRAWEWSDFYRKRIVGQFRKMGSSCDWDRERFTMDEGLNQAVLEFFTRLYDKGYVYRGEKLVNWCSTCKTSISDAEVTHVDREAKLYNIKYRIKDTDEYIQFATTRPETILGDTAVAVNPGDERYTGLIGKTAIVPFVNREIPIISDDYVDKEFGTGVVKITPGHDPNDFMVGERHNLPRINILNDDGTMNENAERFEGLKTEEARKRVLEELDKLGLYIGDQKISHSVGVHDRCKQVVEPRLKIQWFVKMEELAKPALDAYKSGELKIMPERFGKNYTHWLENIRDWCVSRQLWWGHRIPAYYCSCGEIAVSKDAPAACPKCGGVMTQDEDVLDTWFSSGLWPLSTLGWPEKTPDFKYFYPTNLLACGWEILFFWGVRMVFSGLEITGKLPFTDLWFHGMVRDENGVKMSKSLGNGIDPLGVVEKYGADALRLSLVMGNTPGEDFRFREEKITNCRNFCNKIWNAARFITMNDMPEDGPVSESDFSDADKWIISSANRLAKEVSEHLDAYDVNLAAEKLYDFIWDEFCDWAIELSKPVLAAKPAARFALRKAFITALKLLHPFMPFITEEVFMALQNDEPTIMNSDWPVWNEADNYPDEEQAINAVKEAVKAVRSIRADMNVPPSKKSAVYIAADSSGLLEIYKRGQDYMKTLAMASRLEFIEAGGKAPDNAVSAIITGVIVYMPLEDLVDPEKEIARLQKEKERLTSEVSRSNAKLNNKGFTDKAPAAVVDEERQKAWEYKDMLEKVEKQIEDMKRM